MAIETIEHDGECTRLHILSDGDGDNVVLVWLDSDIGTEDGIAIGLGTTRREALLDAIEELEARLVDLRCAVEGG